MGFKKEVEKIVEKARTYYIELGAQKVYLSTQEFEKTGSDRYDTLNLYYLCSIYTLATSLDLRTCYPRLHQPASPHLD